MLDFLFLVGELEEAKFHGNSAETALIACKDKLDDVRNYYTVSMDPEKTRNKTFLGPKMFTVLNCYILPSKKGQPF